MDVAIFGIFRSGTNYVRALLELNYDCQVAPGAYGWKHGFYPSTAPRYPLRPTEMPVVVVVKSPAFSAYSLHRYYAERHTNIRAGEELSDFLRDRIVFFDSFNKYGAEYRFPNPIQMWNGMNWHYSTIKPRHQPLHIVRYEDALRNPANVAEAIASTVGLGARTSSGPFVAPEARTRNMSAGRRSTPDQYVTAHRFEEKEYYLSRNYLDVYSEADLEFIRSQTDGELTARLGYSDI